MHESFVTTHSGTKLRIPDYDGLCITQLPAFFQSVLGHKSVTDLAKLATSNRISLDGVKHVVFFLVDGFGYSQWTRYSQDMKALQRFAHNGYVGQIDSVFPSSTPVALNVLHANGLVPAAHGLIDWWLYVNEIDKIIATLPFMAMGDTTVDSLAAEGVSPKILLNAQTTYEHLEANGIKTRLFMKQDYTQTTYTQVSSKGTQIIPHKDEAELFTTLEQALGEPSAKPTYNHVYWPGIDTAGHMYGPGSAQHAAAVASYFETMETFLHTTTAQDTLFVISADHGQINVSPEETIDLEVEGLSALFRRSSADQVILPWGGSREGFLAIQDGRIEEALALLHRALGEQVELLRSQEALAAGLFGHAARPHPDLLSRIGDIIVLPKDKRMAWYRHPGEERREFMGHHGGLTEEELKVPFALLRS